ncbi:hypothetical protein [Streptomyces sp. A0592]|uniref:hypothetical protein n=1 Tax=Streptomyces sp. A0592 TaxID=2563099 RepID=UPI00109E9C1C|nr:hypothetical protein [Streptomyces sp. A0592]THA86927.1 hypothetical protein E6U81_02320 [Streptomyces sp. A0592]
MTRRYVALRAYGCAAAGWFFVAGMAGCTADGTAKGGATSRAPAASSAPSTPAAAPSASPAAPSAVSLVPELDESKQPKTAAEARELLARILITEDAFGPDVVRGAPFESSSGRWPVLDERCVWQTADLPPDVLATNTRYFLIPAANGHGRVRLNATVTIHHDRGESGWETARAMEEVLRCPDQKLREGEDLQGLLGNAVYQGEQMNNWSEDAFSEMGKYVSATDGGPHTYFWYQAQYGPVTVAITGKGAEGFKTETLTQLVVQGNSRMLAQAKQALGKAAG